LADYLRWESPEVFYDINMAAIIVFLYIFDPTEYIYIRIISRSVSPVAMQLGSSIQKSMGYESPKVVDIFAKIEECFFRSWL